MSSVVSDLASVKAAAALTEISYLKERIKILEQRPDANRAD